MDCVGGILEYVGREDEKNAESDFQKIESNSITHGVVLGGYAGWDKYPLEALKLANNKGKQQSGPKGCIVFIGGGGTVKDIINLAANGNEDRKLEAVPIFLYDGFGASKEAGKHLEKFDSTVYQYSDAFTLINNIYQEYGKEIFTSEFDINNLKKYIDKTEKEIAFDYEIFERILIEEQDDSKQGDFKERLNIAKKFLDENNVEVAKSILGSSKDVDIFIKSYIEKRKIKHTQELGKETIGEQNDVSLLDTIAKEESKQMNNEDRNHESK